MKNLLFKSGIRTLKVTFYMSGGTKVILYCKYISLSRLTESKGDRKLRIEDCKSRSWTIDVDEVQAMKTRISWFGL